MNARVPTWKFSLRSCREPLSSANVLSLQFMMIVSHASSLNAIKSPFNAMGLNDVAILQMDMNDGFPDSRPVMVRISMLLCPLCVRVSTAQRSGIVQGLAFRFASR